MAHGLSRCDVTSNKSCGGSFKTVKIEIKSSGNGGNKSPSGQTAVRKLRQHIAFSGHEFEKK